MGFLVYAYKHRLAISFWIKDERETTNTLLDYHRFFRSEEEMNSFIMEECETMDCTYEEYIEDEDIRKW